jgi:glycerol-3-phosphate dehydrogenase
MRQNAPHLVSDLAFVVPSYAWWVAPFYGLGLKLYQALSGRYGFGPSQLLSKEETLTRLPTIETEGLRGGVIYYDGQFDDSRLLINMVATAAAQGAILLNYAKVIGLTKDRDGIVNGVIAQELEKGKQFKAKAAVVINATGAFTDTVRHLAEPKAASMISPSQGVHLVFDKSFLPGNTAIMVPRTSDRRVMFAIPWHDHTLVGTTDTPIREVSLEPVPLEHEIKFILETAGRYLHKAPSRRDILSAFAGIRPLVKSGDGSSTAALSRDHSIHIDASGLLTITGGKWTTYRNMAEDCVNQAATLARLSDKRCLTRQLHIHGYHEQAKRFGPLSVYGSDAPAIQQLIRANQKLGERLHPALPYCGAEVVWAARQEMARTVEDVLARRTRALFLNARAAIAMAPRVGELLAQELGRDRRWQTKEVKAFQELATGYLVD